MTDETRSAAAVVGEVHTRCKFMVDRGEADREPRQLSPRHESASTPKVNAEEITLSAAYEQDPSPEAQSFAQATPTGTLTFRCDNPVLLGTFVPGRFYYLDLTPAE